MEKNEAEEKNLVVRDVPKDILERYTNGFVIHYKYVGYKPSFIEVEDFVNPD